MANQALEERLAQLENKNRLQSLLLMGISLCLLFFCFAGKAEADTTTVKASRFELVDASGETVGLWQAKQDGNEFLLARPSGDLAVKLTASANVAGMLMFDTEGSPRLFTLVDHQLPSFNLLDSKSEIAGSLGMTATGPKLDLKDAKGKIRARVGVAEDESYMILRDDSGAETWKEIAR
jgi:hypothetical protein